MSLSYERTGGFAGVRQRLEVSAEGHAKVTDRFTGAAERALTAAEKARLDALVAGAKQARPPAGGETSASDSFTVRMWLDGEPAPRVTLSVMSVPLEGSDGSPWGDLIDFADRLLTTELERTRPASAPRILSARDLEK